MRLCTRVVAAWASPRAAAEIWKAGFGWLIIFLNGARSWSLSDLESHLRHHHHHLPQPERGGGERDLTFVRELIRLFCGHVVTAPVKTNFSFPVELSIIIWCVIANPLNAQATTCQATGNRQRTGRRWKADGNDFHKSIHQLSLKPGYLEQGGAVKKCVFEQ